MTAGQGLAQSIAWSLARLHGKSLPTFRGGGGGAGGGWQWPCAMGTLLCLSGPHHQLQPWGTSVTPLRIFFLLHKSCKPSSDISYVCSSFLSGVPNLQHGNEVWKRQRKSSYHRETRKFQLLHRKQSKRPSFAHEAAFGFFCWVQRKSWCSVTVMCCIFTINHILMRVNWNSRHTLIMNGWINSEEPSDDAFTGLWCL